MRIYQSSSGHFYVSQKKESGWFCFHMTPPDIYDVKLCECCFGQEEKNAWELAKDVSSEDYKHFNEMMQRNKNYTDVRDFIMKYYDVSTGFVDKKLDFRPEIVDLTKWIIKKSGYEDLFSKSHFPDLYHKVRECFLCWDGDIVRTVEYILKHHDVINTIHHERAYIDIWGTDNKHISLLSEFHGWWNEKKLEKIVDKACDKYPDDKDFDKRYYYVKDKIRELEKEQE